MTGQMCSRRYLLASVAAGLFARSLAPFANAQNAPHVRVRTLPIEEGAQVFYAQEHGFFPQIRVDVGTLPNAAAVVAAVASGEIELGFGNLFAFAQAFARGLPVRVLAAGQLFRVEDSKSFVLVVRADSPYQAAKDLNGKKIGAASPVSIVGVGARAWIDRNGGDSSTVQVVQVPFGTVEQAFETGRADAVSATLSDLAAVKNINLRVMGYPTDAIGPPFIGSGWYAHTAWISANRDLARRCAQSAHRGRAMGERAPGRIRSNLDEVSGPHAGRSAQPQGPSRDLRRAARSVPHATDHFRCRAIRHYPQGLPGG